jgi:hypothetical protein
LPPLAAGKHPKVAGRDIERAFHFDTTFGKGSYP